MKYLEEIVIGDCFILDKKYYILTSDFKKDGKKYCINLKTGFGVWISPDSTVESVDIFTLDKDSNIIAIKERNKDSSNDLSENY
jgi:hypothetical protein